MLSLIHAFLLLFSLSLLFASLVVVVVGGGDGGGSGVKESIER
jgi:hypothetical protein